MHTDLSKSITPSAMRSGRLDLPSIAIIIPYIGDLPGYFHCFIKSCRANPTIDVVFISDSNSPSNLPDNVHWIITTREDLRAWIECQLNVPVSLNYGYKLCDLKPAYGIAFAALLEQFDFWGFGDIDVIWGDLRSFWTPEWLAETDVASFRGSAWISGSLGLMRNIRSVNKLFAKSPSYREAFASEEMVSFCEINHRFAENRLSLSELIEEDRFVSFTDVVRAAASTGEVRFRTPFWVEEPSFRFRKQKYFRLSIFWDGERLIDTQSDKEFILFHYEKVRKEPFFHLPERNEYPDKVFITPFGLSAASPRSVHGTVWSIAHAITAFPRIARWIIEKIIYRLRAQISRLNLR